MVQKTTGIACFFIMLGIVFTGPALGAAPLGAAVGLRALGGLELTPIEPFQAKAQGAVVGGAFVETRFNRWLGLGLSVGTHYAAPSNLSGGFLYRGHWGTELRPYLSFRWFERPASGVLELAAGNLLGPVLRYDAYLLTYRYFFYMGVGLEPYLELYFSKGDPVGRHSLVV
jgi:hypothetical protein